MTWGEEASWLASRASIILAPPTMSCLEAMGGKTSSSLPLTVSPLSPAPGRYREILTSNPCLLSHDQPCPPPHPGCGCPLIQDHPKPQLPLYPLHQQEAKKDGASLSGKIQGSSFDIDAYLIQLVRYIHCNPVRAGMVTFCDEYRWSSHLTYLGREVIP